MGSSLASFDAMTCAVVDALVHSAKSAHAPKNISLKKIGQSCNVVLGYRQSPGPKRQATRLSNQPYCHANHGIA